MSLKYFMRKLLAVIILSVVFFLFVGCTSVRINRGNSMQIDQGIEESYFGDHIKKKEIYHVPFVSYEW